MPAATFDLEQKLYKKGYQHIAGIDEAGRGSWAGPIVAAAVILSRNFPLLNQTLRDSKQLSAKQRDRLCKIIKANSLNYQISIIDRNYIDQYGINQANIEVIKQSALKLQPQADCLLIDGLKIAISLPTYFKLIPQGDSSVASIAAASILAKTARDYIMQELAKKYPQYGFDKHKGYGTAMHQEKLTQHGPCAIHRQSYGPIKKYLTYV
ncbi:MAG: ribonuclease HII [Candidatus Jacksonbacteria bacterium]